jgi:hypothetical protein
MFRSIFLLGALLAWAPLFSQTSAGDPEIVQGKFVWFRLLESKDDVRRAMGLARRGRVIPSRNSC